MTTILLIRHGQSVANLTKTFAGQSDSPLTELGISQAKIASKHLKNTHFDKVYSSTLSRAFDTAKTIIEGRNFEIITDIGLCETNLGDWEGQKIELLRDEYTRWRREYNYAPPNGENTYEVRERFGKTLDRIAAENEGNTILVATHGGCIRLLPSYYANNDDKLIASTPIASNVSITTVIYENRRGRVEKYADDSYLGDMITRFDNGN